MTFLFRRDVKVPKKDIIKMFVRAKAVRASTHPNSPWVVDADLVKTHELRGKFADFLISPANVGICTVLNYLEVAKCWESSFYMYRCEVSILNKFSV